jgi:hypothetical protein
VSGEDRSGDSLFLHLIAKAGFKKVYVLNGHTGAMLHLWEYFKITGDKVAKDVFDNATRYLESHLPEFDAGDWSYYDKVGTKARESYQRPDQATWLPLRNYKGTFA